MDPMKEKKTEVLTVRITPSAKKTLEAIARGEDRSLSQVVWIILAKAIALKKA